jgi:hypothetical protein
LFIYILKQPLIDATKLNLDKQVNIAGFYIPTKGVTSNNKEHKDIEIGVNEEIEKIEKKLNENLYVRNETNVDDQQDLNNNNNNIDKNDETSKSSGPDNQKSFEIGSRNESIEKNNEDKSFDDEEEEENNEDDAAEDNDDDGWITPSNFEQVKKMSLVESEQQDLNNLGIKVACMTSDFSMQVNSFNLKNLISIK